MSHYILRWSIIIGMKNIIKLRISGKDPDASLSEMISRITKKNRHRVTDWGTAVGNEVW